MYFFSFWQTLNYFIWCRADLLLTWSLGMRSLTIRISQMNSPKNLGGINHLESNGACQTESIDLSRLSIYTQWLALFNSIYHWSVSLFYVFSISMARCIIEYQWPRYLGSNACKRWFTSSVWWTESSLQAALLCFVWFKWNKFSHYCPSQLDVRNSSLNEMLRICLISSLRACISRGSTNDHKVFGRATKDLPDSVRRTMSDDLRVILALFVAPR